MKTRKNLLALTTFFFFPIFFSLGQSTDAESTYAAFRTALTAYGTGNKNGLSVAKEHLQELRAQKKTDAKATTLGLWLDAEMACFEAEFEDDIPPEKLGADMMQAIETLKKSGEVTLEQKANRHQTLLYRLIFNQGVTDYEEGQMSSAYSCFMVAMQASSTSEDAILYAGYAAEELGKHQEAMGYFQRFVMEMNGKDEYATHLLIRYLRDEQKNYVQAEQLWKKAVSLFPNDKSMWMEGVNLYLRTNNVKEQITLLEKLTVLDPTDGLLMTKLGSLYEAEKKPDLAEPLYLKAVTQQPDIFETNYALGAYFFNKGTILIEQINRNPLGRSGTEHLEEEVRSLFNRAQPYLSKALEIRPSHRETFIALEAVKKWVVEK